MNSRDELQKQIKQMGKSLAGTSGSGTSGSGASVTGSSVTGTPVSGTSVSGTSLVGTSVLEMKSQGEYRTQRDQFLSEKVVEQQRKIIAALAAAKQDFAEQSQKRNKELEGKCLREDLPLENQRYLKQGLPLMLRRYFDNKTYELNVLQLRLPLDGVEAEIVAFEFETDLKNTIDAIETGLKNATEMELKGVIETAITYLQDIKELFGPLEILSRQISQAVTLQKKLLAKLKIFPFYIEAEFKEQHTHLKSLIELHCRLENLRMRCRKLRDEIYQQGSKKGIVDSLLVDPRLRGDAVKWLGASNSASVKGEVKGSKEKKDTKDGKEIKETKDVKEIKELKEKKETKDVKEVKEKKESKEGKEVKERKEQKENKDGRETNKQQIVDPRLRGDAGRWLGASNSASLSSRGSIALPDYVYNPAHSQAVISARPQAKAQTAFQSGVAARPQGETQQAIAVRSQGETQQALQALQANNKKPKFKITVEVNHEKDPYEVDDVIAKKKGYNSSLSLKITCVDDQGKKTVELRHLSLYQKEHLQDDLGNDDRRMGFLANGRHNPRGNDRVLRYTPGTPGKNHGNTPIGFHVRSDGRLALLGFNDPNISLTIKSPMEDVVLENTLVCRDLTINAPCIINDASVLTDKARFTAKKKGFYNYKHVLTREDLEVTVLKEGLMNHSSGVLLSQGSLNLNVSPLLENHGFIAGRQLLQCTLFGKCQNSGGMVSGQKVHIFGNGLVNTESGYIFSKNAVRADIDGPILSDGEILSEFDLAVASTQGIELRENSKVLSRRAHVFSTGKIQNHGLVIAKTWLDNASGDAIENGPTGRVESHGFAKFEALKNLEIDGDVLAGRLMSFVAPKMSLEEDAQISSFGDVFADGQQLKNASQMRAKGQVELTLEELFENCAGATASASDKLFVKTKILKNRGAETKVAQEENVTETKEKDENVSAEVKRMDEKNVAETKRNQEANQGGNQGANQAPNSSGQSGKRAGFLGGGRCQLESTEYENGGTVHSYHELQLKSDKITNLLEAYVFAFGDISLETREFFINAGKYISKKGLRINSPKIDNLLNGKIAGESLHLTTNTLGNRGHIQGNLFADVKETLDNFIEGVIDASSTLRILSRRLQNQGKIHAVQNLTLEIRDIVDQQASGNITAESCLGIVCGGLIRNAGNIEGLGEVKLVAEEILQELTAGSIISQQKLLLIAKLFKNMALISGSDVTLKIDNFIKNYAKGQIRSHQTLQVMSENVSNEGTVKGGSLHVREKNKLFANLASGNITMQEAVEILTEKLENSGTLKGNNVKLTPSVNLHNLKGGNLSAETKMTLESAAVINDSVIDTPDLLLQKTALFENHKDAFLKALKAELIASRGVNEGSMVFDNAKLVFDNFTLSGKIESKELSLHTTQILTLLQSSVIQCHEALKLISDSKLVTEGDILAKQLLEVTASLIELKGKAKSVEGDLVLKATDLILAGQLEAARKIVLTVKNHFDWWEKSSFEAGELTQFNLDKGYVFKKPMHKKCSLVFECLPEFQFQNLTDLVSDKDLKFVNGRLINGDPNTAHTTKPGVFARLQGIGEFSFVGSQFDNAHGGVYGGNALTLDCSEGMRFGRLVEGQKWRIYRKTVWVKGQYKCCGAPDEYLPWHTPNGSYLATNGKATLVTKRDILNEGGELDLRELEATAVKFDNTSGRVNVRGNATVNASLHHHLIYDVRVSTNLTKSRVYSADPTWVVGGNFTQNGPIRTDGGCVSVGGKANLGSDQSLNNVEEYDKTTVQVTLWRLEWKSGLKGKTLMGGKKLVPYSADVPVTKSISQHSGSLAAQAGVFGSDPNAKVYLGAALQTSMLSLPFSQLDIPKLAAETAETEALADLSRHYSHSRLFREGGNPNSSACISPEVPLTFEGAEMLLPRVLVGSANAALPPKFDITLEARFAQMECLRRLGRAYLNQSAHGNALESCSPERLYIEMRCNAYQYAQKLNTAVLTEAQLRQAPMPMIVYREGVHNGRAVLVAHSYIPLNMKSEDRILVERADLQGNAESRMAVTGKFTAVKDVKLKVETFSIAQLTTTDYQWGLGKGQAPQLLQISAPMSESGIFETGSTDAEVGTYNQVGGRMSSGPGGTKMSVRENATISALRTEQVLQGERDYTKKPNYTPAYMTSAGNQKITVGKTFGSRGMVSAAGGKNKLKAKTIKQTSIAEEYAHPTVKNGKKIQMGSSSELCLGAFVAGTDAKLHAEKDAELTGIAVGAGRHAGIRAENASLSALPVRDSQYTRERRRDGLRVSETERRVRHSSPLVTSIAAGGNVSVRADVKATLEGTQTRAQGNIGVVAPQIESKGAKETTTVEVRTKSAGLSCFGSEAVAQALSGNTKGAAQALLNQDPFLRAASELAKARDGAGLSIGAIETFVKGWELIKSMSTAVNKNDNLLGALTDRWGITSVNANGERIFNPAFTVTVGQSFESTVETRVHPAQFISDNGRVDMEGDDIRLKDGTRVSGRRIRIIAQELLEISAAENRRQTRSGTDSASVTFTVRDPSIGSVGCASSRSQSNTVQHQAAALHATESIELRSGNQMNLKSVEATAPEINLTARTIVADSAQDSHDARSTSWNANASMTSVGGGFGQQTETVRKTVPTKIHATNALNVTTNTLVQRGSSLISDNNASLQRVDGDGPVDHQVEHLKDINEKRSVNVQAQVSLVPSPIPVTGSAAIRKESQNGETLATFAAPNMRGQRSSKVNTNANNTRIEGKKKKSSMGIGIALPNAQQMRQSVSEVQQAAARVRAQKSQAQTQSQTSARGQTPVVQTPTTAQPQTPNTRTQNTNSQRPEPLLFSRPSFMEQVNGQREGRQQPLRMDGRRQYEEFRQNQERQQRQENTLRRGVESAVQTELRERGHRVPARQLQQRVSDVMRRQPNATPEAMFRSVMDSYGASATTAHSNTGSTSTSLTSATTSTGNPQTPPSSQPPSGSGSGMVLGTRTASVLASLRTNLAQISVQNVPAIPVTRMGPIPNARSQASAKPKKPEWQSIHSMDKLKPNKPGKGSKVGSLNMDPGFDAESNMKLGKTEPLLWKKDLTDRATLGPNASAGLRLFGYADGALKGQGNNQKIKVKATGKAGGGLNLASGQLETENAQIQMDINAATAKLYAMMDVEVRKDATGRHIVNAEVGAAAQVMGPEMVQKIAVKELVIGDKKLACELTVGASLGNFGGAAHASYHDDPYKVGSGSFALSVGAGTAKAGARGKLECTFENVEPPAPVWPPRSSGP